MKNLTYKRNRTFFKSGVILLFILLLLNPANVYSQYEVGIWNSTMVSESSYEFDIYIKSTENSFILSSYQTALSFNPAIKNGGVPTFVYIEGSSELENFPSTGIGLINENGTEKLCFASNSGSDLITTSYKKIGRFRLTNTVPYTAEIPEIKWVFSGDVKTIYSDGDYNDITLETNYSDLNDPIPMPVELTAFEAKSNGNKIELKWMTVTEVNVCGFEIQRRYSTENDWEKVGFVNAAGTSTVPRSYKFTDNPNKNGEFVYRLKSIDIDGQFEYSNESAVKVEIINGFKLCQNYPNPFNPTTRIKYSLKSSSKVLLEIFNSVGELVSSLINENQDAGIYEVNWKADNLSSGIYLSRLTAISNEDGKLHTAINKMQLLK